MGRQILLTGGVWLALVPALHADVLPVFGGLRARPLPLEIETAPGPPAKLTVHAKCLTQPAPTDVSWWVATLAVGCCFVTGGLWLARVPYEVLLGVGVPLGLIVLLAGSGLFRAEAPPAPPVRANTPLFTGPVELIPTQSGWSVRLALPARPRP